MIPMSEPTSVERRELRRTINAHSLSDYVPLEKSKNGLYCCPICGSGHGKDHTGALKLYPDNGHGCRAVCYAGGCFDENGKQGEDTLGALCILWDCNETEVFTKTGLLPSSQPSGNKPEVKASVPAVVVPKQCEPLKEEALTDFTEYYEAKRDALQESPEALEYLHKRGLADETIGHFWLGYDECSHGAPRIIVPLCKYGYLARSIVPLQHGEKIHIGKKYPFNWKALKPNLGVKGEGEFDIVFPMVVEGAFDAMRMWQWGYRNTVALNGLSAGELIKIAVKKAPDTIYILALDNDEPGIRGQQKVAEEIQKAGLSCISTDQPDLYGAAKDMGEVVQELKVCTRLNEYLLAADHLRAKSIWAVHRQ